MVATDFTLLLNPELDYEASVKEVCRFCEFFLNNGPALADRPDGATRLGNPNRFLL